MSKLFKNRKTMSLVLAIICFGIAAVGLIGMIKIAYPG